MRSLLPVLTALFATAASLLAQVFPPPQSVNAESGSLVLTKETSVSLGAGSELVGRHFAERLRPGTGWPVPVVEKGTIRLEISPQTNEAREAYTLRITPDAVTIRSATPAGIVRGAESLLQLMPPAVYGAGRFESLTLPAMTVTDAPQFAWRGAMLDVSRKFQNKETILKLLDGLAACKLNVFHWHLTDDQGWRLPIEGYPNVNFIAPVHVLRQLQHAI